MSKENKNHKKTYDEIIQSNIKYVQALIVQGQSNYEIIDSIEKVLNVISDNRNAQIYTLWKINLFLVEDTNRYVKAALALNNAKKTVGLDVFQNDNKYDERQLLGIAEERKLVASWIINLYAKIGSIDDTQKANTLNYPENILKEIFIIKENTQEIKNSIDTIMKGMKEEFGHLSYLITQFNADQIVSIGKVINQLDEVDSKLIELDWNNELFKDRINELISNLDKFNFNQNEKTEIKTTLENPEIAIKHKLKIVVPILYKFLVYEGEIELGEKQKIPENWKQVKELLLRNK